MQLNLSSEEFCELAQRQNIIALTAEISTDMETPVSVYYKLVGEEQGFILESADVNERFGRFSFIGAEPLAQLAVFKDHTRIVSAGSTEILEGEPVAVLKEYLARFESAAREGALPLLNGGAVGYFNYEVVTTFDRIRGLAVAADQLLGQFMICREMLVMDHFKNTSKLVYLTEVKPGQDAAAVYMAATAKLQAARQRLTQQVQKAAALPGCGQEKLDFSARYGKVRPEFLTMITKAKEHIAAGDAFQIVLSEQFEAPVTQSPFRFYRRLRQVNPSAYMFYLNFGAKQLIGASPEMLVKLDADKVYTYPIAGSRPRGKTAAEDQQLAEELCQDGKECAEHAMLVDLSRNDLGRISCPGSVVVHKLMQVEKFSHIMHMVSEVCGRVRPDYSALDVLKACFPAGTLSGAPKIRAMEIIEVLEEKKREAYGGTVGYLDFNGNMDMCITIRTIRLEAGQAVIRAGAGIVADSVADREYREILQKAGALFQVVEEVENNDFID